jgi:hypothetical protein
MRKLLRIPVSHGLPLARVPSLVPRLDAQHRRERFLVWSTIARVVGQRLFCPAGDAVAALGHVQLPSLIIKPLAPPEQFVGEPCFMLLVSA